MKRILLILLLILAAIYLSIPQRRDQEGTGTQEREIMTGKRELRLVKAGATHYEVRLMPDEMLMYIEPDEWQGKSDVLWSAEGGSAITGPNS
ncbi:hypothetical protein D9Q81_06515 [Candidatus Korarchaeum cryptofilum]|jgi:hypothetical protein|uniref:Uncharacterized protein n=1 Tax=Candidatus Korarchaeum cryptofilum TaxID=498846 RepID=A0A429G3D5_9CREN|nr:hypothetical protein [Candidatus Korarchaeum cryptofilum]RSN68255.1 hypothetical protein D9Q81_06515 [Candidatus Korarchaeum cryptofilum]